MPKFEPSKRAKRAFTPYGLKPWFTHRLANFIHVADRRELSPDLFTLIGVLGALVGAIILSLASIKNFQLTWWASASLVFFFGLVVRLGGANLDGAVARARGVSRPTGFVINELGDRISDLMLFFGLYLGSPEPWRPLVFFTAMLASLPTLVAISGAAVGVSRLNGGPFGKTERSMAFVLAAALLPHGLNLLQAVLYGVILALIALGSILTSLKRFRLIIVSITKRGTSWVDNQPIVVRGSGSK